MRGSLVACCTHANLLHPTEGSFVGKGGRNTQRSTRSAGAREACEARDTDTRGMSRSTRANGANRKHVGFAGAPGGADLSA